MDLNPAELQRFVDQIQRKRTYNRKYYHERVKPKREKEKQELDHFRQCNVDESIEEITRLRQENEKLMLSIAQLQEELATLKETLDITRKRNYDLMMEKADHLIPKLGTISLRS